jgi:hypothetical protein
MASNQSWDEERT